ncbi:hypothetical protein ACTTBA_19995, partial [Shewanella frigidimarina]
MTNANTSSVVKIILLFNPELQLLNIREIKMIKGMITVAVLSALSIGSVTMANGDENQITGIPAIKVLDTQTAGIPAIKVLDSQTAGIPAIKVLDTQTAGIPAIKVLDTQTAGIPAIKVLDTQTA